MRHEVDYLADIIEYADDIAAFIENVRVADFIENDLLRSTVSYKLIIIGEAAARISNETRQRFSDVPWKQIVGFRSQIVHGYFATDYAVVFSVAVSQLPVLRQRAIEMIRQLESQ